LAANWTVFAIIIALAAARPILMEINYAAYAAVLTPLVILLLDFGQTVLGGHNRSTGCDIRWLSPCVDPWIPRVGKTLTIGARLPDSGITRHAGLWLIDFNQ
jgi:hypothetical protein